MPFALCPGETEIWSTTTQAGGPTGRVRSYLTVTTHRVIAAFSRSGDTHNVWIPLDMVDSATYGRFREAFSFRWFFILSLLLIVPGLIYLIVWFFGRNELIIVNAGGEERVRMSTGILQGGLPTEFLDAVACARHSLLYGASPNAPMTVTLNP